MLDLKQKEDDINKNILKYDYISELSSDIALEWDFTSDKRVYSKKITDMLGYEDEEINGISGWLQIVHPDDKNLVQLNFNKYLYGELDYYSQEYRVIKKSGEYIWIRVSGKLLKDSNGKANYFFGVITDISKIKEEAKKFLHLSYFDSLTGLSNLTKFKNEVNSVTSDGSKEEYLFVTLDFDNFKFINESFGYEVGDLILLESSERLRDLIPEKFFSARYENDQFFLFIKINRRKIEDIIKKIRDIFSYPFSIEGKTFYISASIGAVIYPKSGDNYEKLFKNAQIALDNCKKTGKGGYSLFLEPTIFGTSDTLGNDNSRYEDKIVVDFEKDTLEIFFQPTFDLSEGRASSFETLARYLKSDGRYINAGEFIPTAEEDEDKINELSINITRKTFEKIRKFNEINGKEVKFSINLSPINLIDKSFINSFLDIFEEYRIPYQNIQIELSEISMVDYLDSLKDNIIFLKDKGVGIV
ncbi:MAG TPA: diguanylate cyclase, partial [Spirochaetota bacterium]|nr:diguanylate cyclase [Spirochaetota bacterium]